jgi:hypothetical protein
MLALIPAVLLVTSHSSLGAANADECKIRPDVSSPPGLHWYYRVDRTSNRHCWYLHAQGMQVHSPVNATSRDRDVQNRDVQNRDVQNDTITEQAPQTVPVAQTPQSLREQSNAMVDQSADFSSRWVDLPKSVDLNAHALVGASNGYAAEQGTANQEEQLSPAWPSVSATKGEVPQNAPAGINFGSISLAGAAVLALLLMTEALVRLVRTSSRTLLQRRLRVGSHPRAEDFELAIDPWQQSVDSLMTATIEEMSEESTGPGELRHLLQRAGTGLRPPQSFAPSHTMQHHDRDDRAQTALQRLESRSFSGMTWAPL